MKTNRIAILAGDGIGPEIMQQALRVLAVIDHDKRFELQFADIGGIAYKNHGQHYPPSTRQICEQADAILFGAVGGPVTQSHLPEWKQCETNSLLALRKHFALSINCRPAILYPSLVGISPLKKSIIGDGIDLLIIRELAGDCYFGEHKHWINNGKRHAHDIAEYNEQQIQAAAHHAFKLATTRCQKVTCVDKANVLATSKLWREVVTEVAQHYPTVELEHMLVDNCAMQLILNPKQFDVIVTSNLFGDILSDAASAIPGSLGLMPSASFNADGFGLYEPSGGSAHDIAGKDCANPIAQILSLSLMLRHSFDRQRAATTIETAIHQTLEAGYRTPDIIEPGTTSVGTAALTDHIIEHMKRSTV